MAFDIGALLSDPNIQQGMGRAGAALSRGESFGEAFDPSELIGQIQQQKATSELLKQILGQGSGETDGVAESADISTGQSLGLPSEDLLNTSLTSASQAGPIKRISELGKPDVIHMSTPETIAAARKNDPTDAFGTNVPPESITATPSGGTQRPFFQALLG